MVCISPPATGLAPTVLLNLVTALLNISLASLFNFAAALNVQAILSNCCAAACCILVASTLSLVRLSAPSPVLASASFFRYSLRVILPCLVASSLAFNILL